MDQELIDQIKNGEFKQILVLSGAGISTNAGIPDYRSKNGIFSQLMKEYPGAKSPESLFSKTFFNENLRKKLEDYINVSPTDSHYLCKWLYDKGWLKRVYTQNIDGLYQKTGLPEDLVVEFHGSIAKNNIVLYGDDISNLVINQIIKDFNYAEIDLIIIMGTSLQVSPFCALPNFVSKNCTRVLVDIHPENAFKNPWTKINSEPEGLYAIPQASSFIKFGKKKVSLRPQWGIRSKWKSQYIITSDCDEWSREIFNL